METANRPLIGFNRNYIETQAIVSMAIDNGK
jgi:hypothetical protein